MRMNSLYSPAADYFDGLGTDAGSVRACRGTTGMIWHMFRVHVQKRAIPPKT